MLAHGGIRLNGWTFGSLGGIATNRRLRPASNWRVRLPGIGSARLMAWYGAVPAPSRPGAKPT